MKRTRPTLLLLFCVMSAAAEEVPLLGISHVAVRVSDIGKARAFYKDALGYDEAFDFKAPDGGLAMAFFKVNDKQFIEVFPGIRPSDERLPYLLHIGFITADVDKAYKICEQLGLKPASVKAGPRDHDRHFVILNPPGQKLTFVEFMQYQPGSVYREDEGKSLSPRRISTHIEHAGILTTDLPAARAFYEKMGFKETWSRNGDDGRPLLVHLRMPGPSGDYVHWHSGDKAGPLFSSSVQNVLEPLVKRGFILLSIDCYFNGERLGKGPAGAIESDTDHQRDTLFKLDLWFGRTLWGMMLRDDMIAIDYLASRPFLALTGDSDPTSPPDGIHILEKKLNQIYDLYGAREKFRSVVYPNVDHTYTPEMKTEMAAWFARWLGVE